ncbi:hypothetical protein Lalb_Chr04g0254201 [Lupinus albus]|uniref:Uncharacterized protein n=1 Tax=Lupinus albus TaxID=3870 RepID=A0A6A4QN32_LUPAL|nr:hypothetical protein Lalb_Chr04g0254201 [Lupinus albus]
MWLLYDVNMQASLLSFSKTCLLSFLKACLPSFFLLSVQVSMLLGYVFSYKRQLHGKLLLHQKHTATQIQHTSTLLHSHNSASFLS